MSCVADATAIASASAPTTQTDSGRSPTPASISPRTASATCVSAIHPRRRPQNGGMKRSTSGAQNTLNVQGACARVSRPTTRMSTPMSRIQSGMAYHTRPRGSPDANDWRATAAVRGERIAVHSDIAGDATGIGGPRQRKMSHNWRMSEKEPTYSEAEVAERLKALPGWYFEDAWIRRVYKTDGWPTTLMLVNAIGYLAEAAYHHPDLSVTWGRLTVKLSTHSAGGITDKDFELARKIEDVVLWRPSGGSLEGTPNKFVRSGDPR